MNTYGSSGRAVSARHVCWLGCQTVLSLQAASCVISCCCFWYALSRSSVSQVTVRCAEDLALLRTAMYAAIYVRSSSQSRRLRRRQLAASLTSSASSNRWASTWTSR